MTEEEDNFTREVTEFNDEYGLTSNRDLVIKKKVKTEINDLENEAALLKNGNSCTKLFYLGLPETEYKSVKYNCAKQYLIPFPCCLELSLSTNLNDCGLTYHITQA